MWRIDSAEQDEGRYWRERCGHALGYADRDLTDSHSKSYSNTIVQVQAVRCVSRTVDDDNRFDKGLATRALLGGARRTFRGEASWIHMRRSK